jgi:hypothetical protein
MNQELLKKIQTWKNEPSLDQELLHELNNLTEGTAEWNKKLLETNQLVMKLIDTYPELAAYVSSNNGLLTVDEAGYDIIKKRLEKE